MKTDKTETKPNTEPASGRVCSLVRFYRATWTIAAPVFVMFLYWVGGGEFSERGEGLAAAFAVSVVLPIIIFSCPVWKE